MRRVILESPYAAATPSGIALNVEYARACLRDCLERNEAPLASHLLYTQPGVLDDRKPDERALGIEAGLAWADTFVCEGAVFYTDRGWSRGMLAAKDHHVENGTPIEERGLPGFGTCQHCGCTDDRACSAGDRPCGWVEGTHRLCDAPACVDAANVRLTERSPV